MFASFFSKASSSGLSLMLLKGEWPLSPDLQIKRLILSAAVCWFCLAKNRAIIMSACCRPAALFRLVSVNRRCGLRSAADALVKTI